MRLVLKRRYTPRLTFGRLFLGNKQICFIREAPNAYYCPANPCLEEGVYELHPDHTESRGWEVKIGDRGMIKSGTPEKAPDKYEVMPVTSYRADGTPLFTKLAFQKLLELLEIHWDSGEVIELQVISVGIPFLRESCRAVSYS